MHVARQAEGSSAHRASVAGLPRHYMWRGKVDQPRHVGRRGQTVRSANKIPVVLFLK
jgi:hypothetical protein